MPLTCYPLFPVFLPPRPLNLRCSPLTPPGGEPAQGGRTCLIEESHLIDAPAWRRILPDPRSRWFRFGMRMDEVLEWVFHREVQVKTILHRLKYTVYYRKLPLPSGLRGRPFF